MILEPGDIICTRSKSRLGKLIRFFTRSVGEPRTKVNHVGVIVTDGPWYMVDVTEALQHVVRRNLLTAYGGKSDPDVAIFCPLNLTKEDRITVADTANQYVGRRYGYLKLLTHLGDWLLQGAYVFRRMTGDKYPICSWLVAHAYAAIGKNFGVDTGEASPDDIWDFCIGNPDKYKCIFPLGRLYEER